MYQLVALFCSRTVSLRECVVSRPRNAGIFVGPFAMGNANLATVGGRRGWEVVEEAGR